MAKVDVKKSTPEEKEKKGERALAPREAMFLPIEGFRREMDRLFDDFFGGRSLLEFPRRLFDWDVEPSGRVSRGVGALSPRIDMHDSDKQITIEAELPGMDEKDIELTLKDGMLTLKGEKKEEKEEKKKDYYLSERSYGSFQRSFRVPDGIEKDKVSADFKKGVLTVTLPKSAKARQAEKKIKIKAA